MNVEPPEPDAILERAEFLRETPDAWHAAPRPDIFANAGGEVTDDIVWHESWVENVYQLSDAMLAGGEWVVDLGANIGAFTLLCLAANPEIKVVAIEPTPTNAAVLRRNLAMNGWSHRCWVVPYAASNWPGEIVMASDGGAAYVERDLESHGQRAQAKLLREMVDDAGCTGEIAVLKMDCEGGEWDVFRPEGDAWALMPRVRWFVAEWHHTDHATFGAFLGRLSETHAICSIGLPERGGQIWAHRHDV